MITFLAILVCRVELDLHCLTIIISDISLESYFKRHNLCNQMRARERESEREQERESYYCQSLIALVAKVMIL